MNDDIAHDAAQSALMAPYVGRLVCATDEVVSFRFKDLADSCFSKHSLVDEVKLCIEDASDWSEKEKKVEDELWDKFGLSDDDLEPIRMSGWTGALEFLLHDICHASHGVWVPGPGYGETKKTPPNIVFSYSGFASTALEIEASEPSVASADVRQKIAKLGWTRTRVARSLGVDPRVVRRWCKPESGRRGISDAEWEKLSALASEPAAEAKPAPEAKPPVAAARLSARNFNDDELAAIDEAIRGGRFRRIERGEWP